MIFIPFTLHKDIKNIFTKKTKQNSLVSVFLINFKDTNNFGGSMHYPLCCALASVV